MDKEDPLVRTSNAIIERADIAVESLIPVLEPLVPQCLPSQMESDLELHRFSHWGRFPD